MGAILIQIILISLNAIFASAEIAVISMSETKLKNMAENRDKRAMHLVSLTKQPAKFLATIQVAITLAGLLGSAFAAESFAGPLVKVLIDAGISVNPEALKNIAVVVITLVLAYFNLVFGELVPKRLAMKKADKLALGLSSMLYGVSKCFAPIVWLLTVSTNLILRMMGIESTEEEETISEEEIRMMLTEGKKRGTIPEEENRMIQNIFDFDDTTVQEICTHRKEMDYLNLDDDIEKWNHKIYHSRHTYYPICGKNRDDVIGILDTKDYFRLEKKEKPVILKQAVDRPYFIPEGMKANKLFFQMKNSRIYFAVIVDEYGGVEGIITIHDLLEALVGELHEIEDTDDVAAIEKQGENIWKIWGFASMEDVSIELNVPVPLDFYDTFNGFVCSIIGKVPNDGENFECESNGIKIKVHSVKGHMIMDTTVELV